MTDTVTESVGKNTPLQPVKTWAEKVITDKHHSNGNADVSTHYLVYRKSWCDDKERFLHSWTSSEDFLHQDDSVIELGLLFFLPSAFYLVSKYCFEMR